jgi:polysaccharide deacetylase family protein (PEP-CTERM system associated)
MLNALTVDLEDWYQGLTSTSQQVDRWPVFEDRVVASTERLLEILDRAGVRATFFVLGYVAEEFPGLIRQVADAGHEIGLHGYHHRQVFRLSPDQFRAEIQRGRDAVETASGQPVSGFRAPMFSINRSSLWALEVLRDLGFRYDSSVFPTRNMLYGYPDAPRLPYRPFAPGVPVGPDTETEGVLPSSIQRQSIHGELWISSDFIEFPLSTLRLFGVNWPLAGGFYFRLLPYPVFRWGLRRLNRDGIPAIIYLHPWELDPGHPRPNPTLRERFTHYYNLKRTEAKLVALLRDFLFGPLKGLLEGVGGDRPQPEIGLSGVGEKR